MKYAENNVNTNVMRMIPIIQRIMDGHAKNVFKKRKKNIKKIWHTYSLR